MSNTKLQLAKANDTLKELNQEIDALRISLDSVEDQLSAYKEMLNTYEATLQVISVSSKDHLSLNQAGGVLELIKTIKG